ncbi:hypothetical protein CQW32_24490 [Pseudomonas putida]|nr:hypothetical protein CHN49_06155 [Pseudomonas putida]OUS86161.1 hypothetical protein CBP05_04825 [Pseudomonas putida]OUS90492.1 hypothetical protein CBP06_04720 [Pseudomonas putida]PJX07734.1 hypothetical protein CQW32_24490 [Pseudomonas putida]PTV53403.1 hypothetical protein DBL05_23890 [Pseudomonas putida]
MANFPQVCRFTLPRVMGAPESLTLLHLEGFVVVFELPGQASARINSKGGAKMPMKGAKPVFARNKCPTTGRYSRDGLADFRPMAEFVQGGMAEIRPLWIACAPIRGLTCEWAGTG